MNFTSSNKDDCCIDKVSSMDMEQEEEGDISQSDPNEERGYHSYASDAEYRSDGYISNKSDIGCENEEGYGNGGNNKGGFSGDGNLQGNYLYIFSLCRELCVHCLEASQNLQLFFLILLKITDLRFLLIFMLRFVH